MEEPIDKNQPMNEILKQAADKAEAVYRKLVRQTGGRGGEMVIVMAMMLVNIRLQSQDTADEVLKIADSLHEQIMAIHDTENIIMKAAARGAKHQ